MNTEDKFAMGVNSMARNTIPAVHLVRAGRWTLDDMEHWLNAVLANDAEYLKTVSPELQAMVR